MLLFHAFGYAIPTGPDAFFFIIACGVVGSLVDSVLGVVMQAKYRCPNDAEGGLVETPPCGGPGRARVRLRLGSRTMPSTS